MAFAQGSRSQLTFIEEASFGVTPSSPAMATLPFTTHSLDLTKQRLQGTDIQSDRIPRIDRHGNRNAAGDIVVDLRATDYDALIESAMFSAFNTAGVIKVGTMPKFLTIEDGQLDIDQYRTFTGMGVSGMSISIAPNQMATTTFSMVGKDMGISGTSLDATPTASSGNDPFDSYSGTITEGGSPIALVTSLEFSLQNSLSPTFVVGSAATPQLEYGRAVVEGTVTAYFEDAALINKFLNETESSLVVSVTDAANTYTFTFGRVKYNGASVPVQNPQSRVITLPFVALYDDTSGEETNLKITKT